MKNFVQLESDPVCAFIIPRSWTPLIHLSIDESLGKVAKIAPLTKDTYVFQENWPPVAWIHRRCPRTLSWLRVMTYIYLLTRANLGVFHFVSMLKGRASMAIPSRPNTHTSNSVPPPTFRSTIPSHPWVRLHPVSCAISIAYLRNGATLNVEVSVHCGSTRGQVSPGRILFVLTK